MTTDQLTYLLFGVLVVIALVFDLGLLSKKNANITLSKALWQTVFWVILALAFMGFVWFEYDQKIAIEYLSAYLTEWSLYEESSGKYGQGTSCSCGLSPKLPTARGSLSH